MLQKTYRILGTKWGKRVGYPICRVFVVCVATMIIGGFALPEDYQKPSEETLKQTLTKIQYRVTQQDATERAFANAYWDNKREGIYVDVVSGEPLFSSTHKYVSGTGWPSFYKPLEADNVVYKQDRSLFLGVRTEVRSKGANSHLGHVFKDGPEPTGKRYCINSAALRFIAKEDLKAQGYGKYLHLFDVSVE